MGKEQTAKKKLIRVKAAKGILGSYKAKLSQGSGLYFALCGPDEERTEDGLKRRIQMSKFVTCREQLTAVPRVLIHKLSCTSFTDTNHHQIDMDNYRLLLGLSGNQDFDSAKQRLFSGKRALNLLEEAAGWTPSVITTIKHEDYTEDYIWLLTGDAKWTMAPQMMSLSALILRIALKFGPLNVDSLGDLLAHFTEFAKTPQSQRAADHNYIGTVRKHIVTLMQNIEEVFTGDAGQYFPADGQKGWSGYGGVDTLIKCSTGNDALHDRLRKHVLNKAK